MDLVNDVQGIMTLRMNGFMRCMIADLPFLTRGRNIPNIIVAYFPIAISTQALLSLC